MRCSTLLFTIIVAIFKPGLEYLSINKGSFTPSKNDMVWPFNEENHILASPANADRLSN